MSDFPQQFSGVRIWQKSKAVKFMLLVREVNSELNPSAITRAKIPLNCIEVNFSFPQGLRFAAFSSK